MYVKALINECSKVGECFWWSGALVSFERCPKKLFLFDLVVFYYTRDPMALLLTARKMDRKIKLLSTTDINVPSIVVSGVGSSDLERSLQELVINKSYYVKREIDLIYRDHREESSQTQTRTFIRLFRRPAMTRPRREIQEEILSGLISEMIRSLCIESDTVRPRVISYTPVSFLVSIDFSKKTFYECIGKKLFRSRSHERYVFENREIMNILLENLKLWKGGLYKQ
ncbi:MAG: hypothetical protein ABWJ42_06340 [Sulfolobales archaeon]